MSEYLAHLKLLSAKRRWAFLRLNVLHSSFSCLFLGVLLMGASANSLSSSTGGLNGEIVLGLGHDTRVSHPEDETLREEQGDAYAFQELALGWETQWTGGQLASEISVRDQQWQRTPEFDTRLYTGYVHLMQRTGPLRSELTIMQARADVDDGAYLELTRVSPAVGKKFGSTVYMRGQLDVTEKTYLSQSDRRAQRLGVRVVAYWFVPRSGWSVSATVQRIREENRPSAYQTDYDFDATIGKLALRHKARWLGYGVQHRLQLRAEERLYDERYDLRTRWQFSQEWQWTKHWAWQWSVRQEDHYSDQATADYAQTRIETQLEWAF